MIKYEDYIKYGSEAAVREAEETKKEASKRIDTYKKKTDDLKNAINELSGQLQDMLIKKKEITVLISQAQERLILLLLRPLRLFALMRSPESY